MKRIHELQKKMNAVLQELAPGMGWHECKHTECGQNITRGNHISVHIPIDVRFNAKQVVGTFNYYFGDVTWDGVVSDPFSFSCSGMFVGMTLDLDSDPRNKRFREEKQEEKTEEKEEVSV